MTINMENPQAVKKFLKSLGDKKREMETREGLRIIAFKNEFDGLELRTHQENGWVRINYYGADGHYEGESYDGKWK